MFQAELNYLQLNINQLREFIENPEWNDEVIKKMTLRTIDEAFGLLMDLESMIKEEK